MKLLIKLRELCDFLTQAGYLRCRRRYLDDFGLDGTLTSADIDCRRCHMALLLRRYHRRHLLRTKYYWVSFLYLAWMWYDRDTSSHSGRPVQTARTAGMYNCLREYFPVKLVKTADLDPAQKHVFGYHPHGVMCVGTIKFMLEATNIGKLFPGIRFTVLTLKLLHYLPFYREYISAMGYCDVSKESISYLFRKKGIAVVILIGGAKEALDANPKETCVVLKERKGLVKVAVKLGAHLCPVYTFGENDILRLALHNKPGSRVRKFRRLFQKVIGYAPIVVVGRGIFNYTFGFIPYRVPIISVEACRLLSSTLCFMI
ncbi:hypothetical protein RvY_15715 [Ramazzottius varieornatus]|uniref:Acyltransferase n=1 Tax=Ramazzottius varieornatus TaxID=947166 RepID=A0A1D1VVX6_RAMVA|nr:hypothetical protein RvY_15715 [Ramazzottius varieornatus]